MTDFYNVLYDVNRDSVKELWEQQSVWNSGLNRLPSYYFLSL